MNAGPVAERVYDSLRRLILEHNFRPGDKLDPNVLAERLSASVTPVREALNVLTGEQLVETHRSDGYHLPSLDEPALKDMYAWANQIANLALRSRRQWSAVNQDRNEQPGDYAVRVGDVLECTARLSVNGEHSRATEMLNARLHAVRVVEAEVWDDVLTEVTELEEAFHAGNGHRLRQLLNAYHRRRIRAAAMVVRAVYRVPSKSAGNNRIIGNV